MSFLKLLHGIGDRLGILETVVTPGLQPAKRIQTRCVSLQELSGEIKSAEIRALADSPAELSIPFETIFETAGISSKPQDWTIERLKQLVSEESLKNKPRGEVQRAVLDRLQSEGASVDDILKDAMARDKAMDAYETFAGEKMQARLESRNRRRLEIEVRIGELQEEVKTLDSALKVDEEKWREWKQHKRQQERELAALVGCLVDHSVITLDEKDEA